MKIGLTLNWKAKWHKPLLSPESWQALPQGEAYCNVLTHYFAQWTPKILGYQILKVGALSGEIAFDHVYFRKSIGFLKKQRIFLPHF